MREKCILRVGMKKKMNVQPGYATPTSRVAEHTALSMFIKIYLFKVIHSL